MRFLTKLQSRGGTSAAVIGSTKIATAQLGQLKNRLTLAAVAYRKSFWDT